MRQLIIQETHLVSAGAHDFNFFNTINTIKSYLKTDILFGAVGLALLFSPGGWGMTVFGTALGAFAGLGYGFVRDSMD